VTTQIAVRLPDRLVEFLDDMVERGEAQSRAEIVKKALMKYERQVLAERDAEVYRTTPDDPDMMALAEWSARQPMSELD
jgi:Arc/MetJ-type ribon-helix-helix transcriptional regulator